MNTKNYLHLIVATAAFACSTLAFSQAPAGFNYQAALRTTAGAPMASQAVTIRFGIYAGVMMNLKVYEETHTLTTSAQGLVNCVVGKGNVVLGNLSTIAWGKDQHHMKVEVNSGTGFVDMGTQQLVSVPYAQYANGSRSTDTAKFAKKAYSSQLADTAIIAVKVLPTTVIYPTQINATGATVGDVLMYDGNYWQPNPMTQLTAGNGVDITGGVIYTPWSITGTSAGSSTYYNNGGYVGIGTATPQTTLDVIGTIKTDAIVIPTNAVTGRVLTSDGSGNASWQAVPGTIASMGSNSGGGYAPNGTMGFVSTPVQVIITSSTQKVLITVSHAMGSSATGGACCLNLYIGYNTTAAQSPVSTVGGGSLGYQCLQGTRNNYTLSQTISNLSPGTYYIGMTGQVSNSNTNWNSNEYGYTSFMVIN